MSSTEDLQREQMREMHKRLKANQQAAWDECKHVAGGNLLSDYSDPSGRTSIVWHELRDETRFGVCLNCQRQFWPTDADYNYWRYKQSYNLSSASDNGEWKPITEEQYKEGSKNQFVFNYGGKDESVITIKFPSDDETEILWNGE